MFLVLHHCYKVLHGKRGAETHSLSRAIHIVLSPAPCTPPPQFGKPRKGRRPSYSSVGSASSSDQEILVNQSPVRWLAGKDFLSCCSLFVCLFFHLSIISFTVQKTSNFTEILCISLPSAALVFWDLVAKSSSTKRLATSFLMPQLAFWGANLQVNQSSSCRSVSEQQEALSGFVADVFHQGKTVFLGWVGIILLRGLPVPRKPGVVPPRETSSGAFSR